MERESGWDGERERERECNSEQKAKNMYIYSVRTLPRLLSEYKSRVLPTLEIKPPPTTSPSLQRTLVFIGQKILEFGSCSLSVSLQVLRGGRVGEGERHGLEESKTAGSQLTAHRPLPSNCLSNHQG